MRKRVLFQAVAIVIVILILVVAGAVEPLSRLVKLNKIYTRTGDGGSAGLVDGSRVSKSSLRMAAIGEVDEANAAIGVAIAALGRATLATGCCAIQNDLFDLGADVATPGEVDGALAHRRQPGRAARARDRRDERGARAADQLHPARAGRAAVAALHLARAVVRRAERAAVALNEAEPLNPQLLAYLNRLSDHLFVAARFVAAGEGGDVLWQPGRDPRPEAAARHKACNAPFSIVPPRNGDHAVPLSAIAINCTLKRSGGEPSSTDKMIGLIAGELAQARRRGRARRSASPTTTSSPASRSDEGDGDAWPDIRQPHPRLRHPDLRNADLARPDVEPRQARGRAHGRLLQRNRRRRPDAELRQGRGARHRRQRGRRAPRHRRRCSRRSTTPAGPIPAQAACYWVGEAMHKTDFKDLPEVPDDVQGLAGILAANAAHLANLLKEQPYPGVPKHK